MKRWIVLALGLMVMVWQAPAHAQERHFNQAELDALLAPIALYPDSVLSHILVAATRPEDLRQAAAWSRANPHLAGEHAVRAAEPMAWHPSVKTLLAFPDLLARMDESPQWTADLAEAFLEQEPYVMDTVQALRQRAQASGGLQSNEHYSVQQHGHAIAIYPVQPHVVYLPYYNPYVVYGPWWWHSHRPVYWRPWHHRPVFVHRHFHSAKVDWPRRHVIHHGVHKHFVPHGVHQPSVRHGVQQHFVRRQEHAPQVTIHNHAHPVRPIIQGARIDPPSAPHRDRRADHRPSRPVPIQHHAPRLQPLQPMLEGVRSHAAPLVNAARSSAHREHRRAEPRREHRPEGRQVHRSSQHRR